MEPIASTLSRRRTPQIKEITYQIYRNNSHEHFPDFASCAEVTGRELEDELVQVFLWASQIRWVAFLDPLWLSLTRGSQTSLSWSQNMRARGQCHLNYQNLPPTHTHTEAHTYTETHIHTHTHTYPHTGTHKCTQTHVRTHVRTHTHTTHTDKPIGRGANRCKVASEPLDPFRCGSLRKPEAKQHQQRGRGGNQPRRTRRRTQLPATAAMRRTCLHGHACRFSLCKTEL